jgi:hypothetical protein
MTPDTVVAAPQRLTKQRLHAKLMRGWSRAIDNHGRGAFLDALGISSQALTKQFDGSMPNFELIDAAFDLDDTVLDDWAAAKGVKIVDKDAVCDSDVAALNVSRLLTWILESQRPDSPGGSRIVHTELLPNEELIRAVHRLTGNWLQQITGHSEPTVLRSVG